MSYKIEHQLDQSTIIITYLGEFDEDAIRKSLNELYQLLNNVEAPVSIIADYSQYEFGFNELLSGTSLARNLKNPFTHHNCQKLIMVSESNLLKASLKGFQQFGLVNDIKIVTSINAALEISSSINE
ncbi:MAG: hypothetical protein AAFQ07_00165 [Chloroflexota bacterium]